MGCGLSLFPVHTLLRIAPADVADWEQGVPRWAPASLLRVPWVVVRRVPPRPGRLPVGVRGSARVERAAAWVGSAAVLEAQTPRSLAAARGWLSAHNTTPAIAALAQADAILEAHGWIGRWGPAGSAGFELASGHRTTHTGSDLDLVLTLDADCGRAEARALWAALASLPVRCDVLLEGPAGAVSLAEYVRDADTVLLRTPYGPRLVQDPWTRHAAAETQA